MTRRRRHRRLLVPTREPRELDTREGRAIGRVRASVCEGKVISIDVLSRLIKRA